MLEGKHFQNAYVTRDVDKWVAEFQKRGKIDKLMVFDAESEAVTVAGPGKLLNRLAFIWIDGLQYELIEPRGGAVDLYREALPADDALQFHHICMRVPDWEDFRARVDQQPYPVVLEGGGDELKYLYLDARPFLGHYLEYTWMNETRWSQIGGPA